MESLLSAGSAAEATSARRAMGATHVLDASEQDIVAEVSAPARSFLRLGAVFPYRAGGCMGVV